MPSMSECDKNLVKENYLHKGWGAKRLMREYPGKGWKKTTINDLLLKFRQTGAIARKAGSGRPKTTRTQQNIDVVEDLIQSQEDNPHSHSSPREIERSTGISRPSVRRIVKKDLHKNVFKRQRVHRLRVTQKAKRLQRAQQLLDRFDTPQKVNRVFFGDEKIFSAMAPVNTQNNRVYSDQERKRDVSPGRLLQEKDRFSAFTVMVSGYVSHMGKGELVFVEEDVTINSEVYQNILRQHIPTLRQVAGAMGFTFQQDGATAHTSNDSMAFIRAHFDAIIDKHEWPPKSCDLSPLDYSIWSAMDRGVYRGRDRFYSREDLVSAIREAWDNLPMTTIKGAIRQWRRRLQEVVDADGGHFEHKL